MSKQTLVTFNSAPFDIIDGDRGKNYPKQNEFSDAGYCLFLNATNVTSEGFNFSQCQFISEQKNNVLRKGMLQRDENSALQAIALMQQGTVIDVDSSISLLSAKQSIDLKLPMADSIILVTAQVSNATLWTQNSDFKNIPGIKYIQK